MSSENVLTPYEKVLAARKSDRPDIMKYIEVLFDDFIEMHGDRYYKDDKSLVAGIASFNGKTVTVIGNRKGKNIEEQRALHLAAGTAAPEVAAAHDDADLDAQFMGLLHAAADRVHGRLVEAGALLAAECLAADLQKDTLIFQCHNNIHHLYQIWPRCALPFLSPVYFTIKLLQSKQANASSAAKVSSPSALWAKNAGHLPRIML